MKHSNKNAWIFLGVVFVIYMITAFFNNYNTEKAYLNANLSQEEKDMCNLTPLDNNRVSLTVPPTYALEATQADLDAAAAKNGYESMTLNENGSVTYIMTQAQHKEMLDSLMTGIKEKIEAMPSSNKSYASITSITYNDDLTDFEIHSSENSMDDNLSMVTVNLKMLSTMYNAFNGKGSFPFRTVYYNGNGEKMAEIS